MFRPAVPAPAAAAPRPRPVRTRPSPESPLPAAGCRFPLSGILLGLLLGAGLDLLLVGGAAATPYDGKRFDPGAAMTAPAGNAPAPLSEVVDYLGPWDVTVSVYGDSGLVRETTGAAEVTFMNRGHALMERLRVPDLDGLGNGMNAIGFLVYNPNAETWMLGVADTYTERVRVYNGELDHGDLVLRTAERHKGSAVLRELRMISRLPEPGVREILSEVSVDGGETWTRAARMLWTRRDDPSPLLGRADGYGSPHPDRPAEAAQFDFLVGEWDEAHDLKRPQGPVKFPQHGTAVHCLGGRAIMEFSWMDVDPSLPDAATCIVRMWNRAERRWECMFMTNRFNSVLHFGGVKEGDRIVLHQFNAGLDDVPLSYWIFHDWTKDSYLWHSEVSPDRGETWEVRWNIAGTRKEGTGGE